MDNNKPTIEVVRDGSGRAIINPQDLEMYQSKGYKLLEKSGVSGPATTTADDTTGSDGETTNAEPFTDADYKHMSNGQLSELANQSGVENAGTMKRKELVAALIAANIAPTAKK